MCGRLNQTADGGEEWQPYPGFSALKSPRINVAPTEELALIYNGKCELARWWLTPSWSDGPSQKYAMFNARSENLSKSPAFRGPFKQQRGIIPMSSFIEWRKSGDSKQPWGIQAESGPLYAAALWDVWSKGESPLLSCTIVTTAAADAFSPWHHRMPVLLDSNETERWLDNRTVIASDDSLFRPELKFEWQLFALDSAVGNSRNKDPALMQSIGEVVSLN